MLHHYKITFTLNVVIEIFTIASPWYFETTDDQVLKKDEFELEFKRHLIKEGRTNSENLQILNVEYEGFGMPKRPKKKKPAY